MSEYIERSAVLQNKTTMTEYDEGGWDAPVSVVRVTDIEAIPAADVAPVVRCRECKHRGLAGAAPFMYFCCMCGDGLSGALRDDDFCSYGERRADNPELVEGGEG